MTDITAVYEKFYYNFIKICWKLYWEKSVMVFKLKALLDDESGATAIEYGLIAALVSVAAIAALTVMGTSLETMFNRVSNELGGAANSSSPR